MTVFDLDIIVRTSLGARSHWAGASWKAKLQTSRFKGVTQLYAQTSNRDQKLFLFRKWPFTAKGFQPKTCLNLTKPNPSSPITSSQTSSQIATSDPSPNLHTRWQLVVPIIHPKSHPNWLTHLHKTRISVFLHSILKLPIKMNKLVPILKPVGKCWCDSLASWVKG